MNRLVASIVEVVVVGGLALGVGLVANARRENGIDLAKAYPRAEAPLVVTAGKDTAAIEAEVTQRLHEQGQLTISTADAFALFSDELYRYEAYVFVDARNLANFQEGHIPHAWHLDPYRVEQYAETVVPQCRSAQKTIVYCNGGQCADSELAAQHLIGLGVPKESLFIFVGGIQAWKTAGYPLETGDRVPFAPPEGGK